MKHVADKHNNTELPVMCNEGGAQGALINGAVNKLVQSRRYFTFGLVVVIMYISLSSSRQ